MKITIIVMALMMICRCAYADEQALREEIDWLNNLHQIVANEDSTLRIIRERWSRKQEELNRLIRQRQEREAKDGKVEDTPDTPVPVD